jgi:hypothetical protein
MSWFHKQRKAVELVDSTFGIEVAFFQGMVGKDGERCLFQQALVALPAEKRLVDMSSALQELQILQESALYKFTEESTQNQLRTACGWLQDLESGRAPKFGSNPSEFLLKVRHALQLFCVSGDMVGAEAAKHMLKTLVDAEGDKKTLALCEGPTRFAWLLDSSERQQLAGIRSALLDAQKTLASAAAALATGNAAASSSASSSKGAAKSAPKVPKGTSELSAALAMFGRSSA